MGQAFNVYPTRGFLNTEFKIKSNKTETIRYYIFNNGALVSEGELKGESTKSLPQFDMPGEYTICDNEGFGRQTIQVEDAIRLGSSELKKSYVFDVFPYIIFVMRDRIHMYDPDLGTYVFSENFISPDQIYALNSHLLLFVSEHPEGTSISLFDVNSFAITKSIECTRIVAKSKNSQKLFAYSMQKHQMFLIDTLTLQIEKAYAIKDDSCFWVNENRSFLYCVCEENIYSLDIESGYERRQPINGALGVTLNGYLIRWSSTNIYYYISMEFDEPEDMFSYYSLFNTMIFGGHSLSNQNWENNIGYDPELLEKNIKQRYADDFKIGKYPKVNQATNYSEKLVSKAKILSSSAEICFYPTREGVYILEKVNYTIARTISINPNSGEVYISKSVNHENNLIWKEKKPYKIEYNDVGQSIRILGTKAAVTVNSKLSMLIEKGVVVEEYEDSAAASQKLKSENPSSKDTIIIDGNVINGYYILCKDNSKLVTKKSGTYDYYIFNQGEWSKRCDIDLREEKHYRASMSSNGKFLVYSKGGNQYALYDLEKKKEETVLSGNFVDFSEGDNIIVSESKRQLRIYDPRTFVWVKDCPEYYNFVSPDKKLFALTSLHEKKYNYLEGNNEISNEEYHSIVSKYDVPSNGNCDIEKIRAHRKQLVAQNLSYFDSCFKNAQERERWINKEVEFTSLFLKKKQYVTIGVSKTGNTLEIEIDCYLSYLNYVSFSYDNKYVSIVGKPANNGYLKLVKICFNEIDGTIEFVECICDMEIANKATWTSAFTKDGLFGTYDSKPNTYLIREDDYADVKKENSYLINKCRISNRSLMCFSPSGKYMALSIQGYEPYSLGGKGHVPSNKMFICKTTENFDVVDEWEYQGSGINKLSPNDPYKKNLVQAGFSIDDKKIMTVTQDGVVVVRNVYLEDKEYVKNNPYIYTKEGKIREIKVPYITVDGIMEDFQTIRCNDDEMWDPRVNVIYSSDGKVLKNCVNIKIKKYKVLPGTETILDKAFHGIFMPGEGDWCFLNEISLPSSIKYMSPNVFEQCPDLKKINVPSKQIERFISILPNYKDIICGT